MGQYSGLCLVSEWPGTITYDRAQFMSRVKKHLDKQHCMSNEQCYVSSAATGEEIPRDLSPLGQCGD